MPCPAMRIVWYRQAACEFQLSAARLCLAYKRKSMRIGHLEFRPIDLEKHSDVCVSFREDSYLCSFGSAEQFHGSDGKGAQRYLEWLRQRMADLPNSCALVCAGARSI